MTFSYISKLLGDYLHEFQQKIWAKLPASRCRLSTIRALAFCSYALLLSSCITVSTMQHARTLKRDTWSYGAALGYQAQSFSTNENAKPVTEAFVRYGLVDRFDLGVKHSFFGNTYVDGKYMFWAPGRFSMSTGLGLSYVGYRNPDSEDAYRQSFSALEYHIPLYTAWDASDWLTLYVTPRYIQRFYTFSSQYGTDSQDTPLMGYSFGTIWGSSWGVLAEYTHYRSFGERQDRGGVRQFMLGFVMGLENLLRVSK